LLKLPQLPPSLFLAAAAAKRKDSTSSLPTQGDKSTLTNLGIETALCQELRKCQANYEVIPGEHSGPLIGIKSALQPRLVKEIPALVRHAQGGKFVANKVLHAAVR